MSEQRGLEIQQRGKQGEFATKLRGFIPIKEDVPHIFDRGIILNGRYRIDDSVGEGGMGFVYRVTDLLRPERPIALKTIRHINLFNVDLFKAEFKTLTDLHHPNLTAVYDFDVVVGTEDYFFTMELVRGSQNILDATEGADWRTVVDLLIPICRALSYIHSRGIIHFDIKPGNLLVSSEGVLKVLDFGIAGLKKMGSTGDLIGGTVNYMAPELSLKGSVIDHRADLYSLGILAYHLLCRTLPFSGSTHSQIIAQHQQAPLTWKEESAAMVPSWLRAIIEHLCEKNPADRFRTANNVIEAINQQGGLSYELETQKTRESYIFSSRFVGREKEFEEITRFVDARVKKQGLETPVIFVSGQSGIGKSRLFREVRYRNQLAKISFIEGNCYEGKFNEYGAIAELITYLVPLIETAGHTDLIQQFGSELAKIEPQFAQRYQLTPSPSLNKPEAEHLRLREQVSEFFVRVAEVIPYTLYINDLQWAPSGTSELIYYLAWRIILRERMGEPCPIALLGSFRSDEVEGRPLEKFLSRLRQENVFKVVELKPLASENIEPMLCSMFGVQQIPVSFLERVTQETAGNPYFVEEVMRTLVENGSVYLESGRWAAATEIEKLKFPTSISDVFLRRAALLSPDQRQIIDLLAVADRPISAKVLERATVFSGETLQRFLATLGQKQIVQASSGNKEFHLSHDRMRETLYQDISEDRRKELHQKMGNAIELTFTDNLTSQLGALAYHFYRAHDRDKALSYSIAAGDDARKRFANDLATSMYEQALTLLTPSDERRYKIQVYLTDIYRMSGRYDDAQTLVQQLLSEAVSKDEKARLHTLMGRILFERSSITNALEEMWRSVELRGEWRPRSRLGVFVALGKELIINYFHRFFPQWIRKPANEKEKQRYIERCDTYSRIAETSWFCDSLNCWLAHIRSTNCGELVGDCHELCSVYSGGQAIYGMMTFYRTAERYGDMAMQMANRLDSDWLRGMTLELTSQLALFRAEWQKAVEASLQGIALLKKGGDYFEMTWTHTMAIHALIYLGQLEEAKKLSEEVMGVCQRTQVKGYCYFLAQHALANAYLGNHEAAVKEGKQAFQIAQKDSSDIFSLCFTEMLLGECLLVAGDIEGAISHLEAAKSIREEKKLMQDWFVNIYPLLARAYLQQLPDDDPNTRRIKIKNIKKLIRKSKKLSKRHPNFLVPSLIAEGMLLRAEGDKRASHSFSEAIKIAEKQESRLYQSQAHQEAEQMVSVH